MPRRTCFIHIGTHKTASTYLQRFVSLNEEVLAKCDIFVPRSGRIHTGSGHHNIAWGLSDDRRFMNGAGDISDMIAEIEGCPEKNVLISSEDFEYVVARGEIDRLVEPLSVAGFDSRFIVFMRRQETYIPSLYTTLLGEGLTLTLDEFTERVLDRGVFEVVGRWIFYFDYVRFLKKLERPAAGRTVCLPFEESTRAKDVAGRFLSAFLGPVSRCGLRWAIEDAFSNRRLGKRAASMMLSANRLLESRQIDPAEYERIASRMNEGAARDDDPEPVVLSEHGLRRVRSRFAASNAILEERYGISWSHPSH